MLWNGAQLPEGVNPNDYIQVEGIAGKTWFNPKGAEAVTEFPGLNSYNATTALGAEGIRSASEYYGVAKQAAQEQMQRSRELWNLWQTNYMPGEIAWAKESFAGIPASQEVARASADVKATYGQAAQQRGLQQSRMGINPASPAYQASQSDIAAAQAAAEAGARTNARRNVREVNYSRRTGAVQAGRNLIPQSSSMAGQGVSMYGSGNQAYQGALGQQMGVYENQTNRDFSANQAALGRNFTAEQNALNRNFQQSMMDQQSESAMWSSIMGLGGMAAGAFIGGPAGAAVGGQLGSMFSAPVASSFGGSTSGYGGFAGAPSYQAPTLDIDTSSLGGY
jgi:hypothetical protein